MWLLIKKLKYPFLTLFLVWVLLRTLSQSQQVTDFLQETLEKTLPGKIRFGSVGIDFMGNVHLRDFEIHVDGIPLVQAAEATFLTDPLALFQDDASIVKKVIVDSLHLRFVKDANRQSLWKQLKPSLPAQAKPQKKGRKLATDAQVVTQHVHVFVESGEQDFFEIQDLKSDGVQMTINPQAFTLAGSVISPDQNKAQFFLTFNAKQSLLQIEGPKLTWTPYLATLLPQKIDQQLKTWQPRGTFNFHYALGYNQQTKTDIAELDITPENLKLTPPEFGLEFNINQGLLFFDPQSQRLSLKEVSFDYKEASGKTLIQGECSSKLGLKNLDINFKVSPEAEVIRGLPKRLAKIIDWTQPQEPFIGSIWKRGSKSSLEVRFTDLTLAGIRPKMKNATGVITCDQSLTSPLRGHIELSSLSCLGLEFNQGHIPLIDKDGLQFGGEQNLIVQGPEVYVEGFLKAFKNFLEGNLQIRGLDVRTWATQLGATGELQNLNGVVNGDLKLNVSKEATHSDTIGSFDFRVEQSDIVISNPWIAPLNIFDLLKAENLNQQRILESVGSLEIYPNKFLVKGRLKGKPLNFDASGKVRFSNSGELEFVPKLLAIIPLDPTKLLLNLIPIRLTWENGKLVKP